MNKYLFPLFILSQLLLVACQASSYNSNATTKNNVIITLHLNSIHNVLFVEFKPNHQPPTTLTKNSLNQGKLGEYVSTNNAIEFSFPGAGEHSCKIRVVKNDGTFVEQELYTEGGYRPVLTFTGDSLVVNESMGNLYE